MQEGRLANNTTVVGDKVETQIIPDYEGFFGGLTSKQSKAVETLFKDGKKGEILPQNVRIKLDANADGFEELTVTVKFEDDTTITSIIKNPSKAEKALIQDGIKSGKTSIKMDKEGIMTFSQTDAELAESIIADTKAATEELSVQNAKLERQLAAINKVEGIFMGAARTVKRWWRETSSFKGFLNKVGNKIWGLIKKVLTVAETLSQAVLFNVPSMILQAFEAQAQLKALYESITSPFKIAEGLYVQIPAQLIPQNNPMAGIFLYIAIDPDSVAPGAIMSDEVLQNASYYVVGGGGNQWGATYANAQGAPATWVNLNTGLVFTAGAQPLDPSNPVAMLLNPSNATALASSTNTSLGNLSVQNYTGGLIGRLSGTGTTYTVIQSLKNLAMIPPKAEATDLIKVPVLETLFAPGNINVTTLAQQLKSKVGSYISQKLASQDFGDIESTSLPPELFTTTLNIFRNGVKNLPGFLPSRGSVKAPLINVCQFKGTGALNQLLGNPKAATMGLDVNVVQGALNIMLNTDSTILQNIVDAQNQLATLMADPGATVTSIEEAVIALGKAEGVFVNTINVAGTQSGLESNIDLNAFNIWLYETADTPIAQFLQKHNPIPFFQLKDYVVFLNENQTMVPLLLPMLQSPGGAHKVGQVAYDPTVINPSVRYMSSLVSGITYSFNDSGGPGKIMMSGTSMTTPDYTISQGAAGQLFTQLTAVLSESTNVINQIVATANYATTLVNEGPYVKNGCILTAVDWESFTKQTPEAVQASIAAFANAQQIPAIPQGSTPFGMPAPESLQSSWIDSVYVYQVASQSLGKDGKPGPIFGTDSDGNPLYDYVVPITVIPGSGIYQIMPLGASALSYQKGITPVEAMVSLVTGRMYDENYVPLQFNTTVIQRNALYQPIAAVPGQYSVPYQTSTGTVEVAAIQSLPMSTAYMPEFANPYNVIMTAVLEGSVTNSDYASQSTAAQQAGQAVKAAALQVTTDISKTLSQGNQASNVSLIWQMLQKNAATNIQSAQAQFNNPRLALYFNAASADDKTSQFAGYVDAQVVYQDIKNWFAALEAESKATSALQSTIGKMSSAMKPPYPAIKKASNLLLQMLPMYWMYYPNFGYCSMQSASQPVSYNNNNVTVNIDWISVTPCQSPSSFSSGSSSSGSSSTSYNLGQSMPIGFVAEIIRSFKGWAQYEDRTSFVAKIMQSGPFQFTHNLLYPVYLNIPPGCISIGDDEIATGNFFYTASVFSPTDLFVVADMVTTASPTIASCNANNHLGMSYLDAANPGIINIRTGDVWVPASVSQANSCYKPSGTVGVTTNALCNLTNLGKVNPQQALLTALKNQSNDPTATTIGALLANLQKENPGLYGMVMNCQTLGSQQSQAEYYPFYFAGRTLRLCPVSGMHIYAVVENSAQSYLEAPDYWVVVNDNFQPTGQPLSPSVQYMMSIVSGNAFGTTSQGALASAIMKSDGASIVKSPVEFFNQMFGTGAYASAGTTNLSNLPSSNQPLYAHIEELNNVVNASFLQAAFKTNVSSSGIMAEPLPLAALQAATPVAGLFSNLYKVNNKYYVKIPGANGAADTWYDFNAGIADPQYDPSTATYSYNVMPGNAARGVYYVVNAPSAAAAVAPSSGSSVMPTLAATPIAELTGYPCQAMLDKFGITISSKGDETLGLSVANISLPMTAFDAQLKPGQSSGANGNMQCIYNPQTTNGSGTYYYVNNAAQMYLARSVSSLSIPVYDQATQTTSTVTQTEDYYSDLVTGEQYDVSGNPYLAPVMVAYWVATNPSLPLKPFTNNDFDFSNPLFMLTNFDDETQMTQIKMLYQNTDVNGDPNYGYQQYSLQPYSVQFSFSDGSGKSTVYAYGSALDTNGNPYITQNGTQISPATTNMTSVLLSALNSGLYLSTKTYTMTLNGAASPTLSSSTLTVVETAVSPVQISITYTDTSGNVITDIFQAPNPTQALQGTGSSNAYNNPPLDGNLQNILLQAKPFWAEVVGARPFNSTPGIPLVSPDGNSPAIVCGLLTQPTATAQGVFNVRQAGVAGLTYTGVNPNGIGAPVGQYFAFYDAYNNAGLNSSGAAEPTITAPSQGIYSTYISVVTSVQDLFASSSPYPGIYAGNFINLKGSKASIAPYLCINTLPAGTINSATSLTAYAVPFTGPSQQYFYSYKYAQLSGNEFQQIKDHVDISTSAGGTVGLISAFNAADLASVGISNPEVNPQAAAMVRSQLFFGKPLIPLTSEPASRYFYKLSCSSTPSIVDPICQLLGADQSGSAQYYIDAYNGVVFVQQTDLSGTTILYPFGFGLTGNLFNLIAQAIGGAIPASTDKEGVVMLQNPALSQKSSAQPVPAA